MLTGVDAGQFLSGTSQQMGLLVGSNQMRPVLLVEPPPELPPPVLPPEEQPEPPHRVSQGAMLPSVQQFVWQDE